MARANRTSQRSQAETDIQLSSPACVLRPSNVEPFQQLYRRVLKLQLITVGWMFIECGVATTPAWHSHSFALLAFGTDSFVELLSAFVVILQFSPWFTLRPAVAAHMAGVLLFTLAAA